MKTDFPNTARHGIWRVLPSPQLTEILAQAGLDFQILDREHGAYGFDALLTDILACDASRTHAWVRVSGTDKVEVQRCLDLGAHGIVFPQLASVEDFRRAASWMDYPPTGTRGFNPFVRAGRYGVTEGAERAPAAFVPIIETLAAVEALDEILTLPRLDLVYLGTYDLSAQLGCPGEMQDARVLQTVAHILERCQHHGVSAGMMSLDPEATKGLLERGVRAIVHGVETHRIRQWAGGLRPV